MQAKAVLSSQKELLPIRIEGVQAKIQKTERKLEGYESGKKNAQKSFPRSLFKRIECSFKQTERKRIHVVKISNRRWRFPPLFLVGRNIFMNV